jgi:hypothetical protein
VTGPEDAVPIEIALVLVVSEAEREKVAFDPMIHKMTLERLLPG